jgi:hypothetical protein
VAVTSTGEAWAVGEGGVILHESGDTWTQVANLTLLTLAVATIGSTGTAWAVGSDGEIVQCTPHGSWRIAEDPFA